MIGRLLEQFMSFGSIDSQNYKSADVKAAVQQQAGLTGADAVGVGGAGRDLGYLPAKDRVFDVAYDPSRDAYRFGRVLGHKLRLLGTSERTASGVRVVEIGEYWLAIVPMVEVLSYLTSGVDAKALHVQLSRKSCTDCDGE